MTKLTEENVSQLLDKSQGECRPSLYDNMKLIINSESGDSMLHELFSQIQELMNIFLRS